MLISDYLKNAGFTQTIIAKILNGGNEPIPISARIRAHRIWHGKKPNDEELLFLYQATDGKIDANLFYNLYNGNGPNLPKAKTKKSKLK